MAKGKIKYTSQAIANQTFDATNRVKKFIAYGMNGSTPVPLAVDSTGGLAGTLTSVDLSTPATDGQILVFDALSSFTATNSPLNWGGNDYKQPALGATHTPDIVYIYSSTPLEIYADGQTFVNEGGSTADLHIGLVTWTDTTRTTLIVADGFLTTAGQAETGSGLQAVLRGAVDPSCTVDNFKATAFTYNASASYTWNGFTGFEQAGTVSVVSGQTTPPAITYVAPPNTWIAGTRYKPHHYSAGIFKGRSDTPQVFANNSAVAVSIGNDIPFTDPYINTGATTFTLQAPNVIADGRGIITLLTTANSVIPSAVIELQKQNQDASFTTVYGGVGGSVSFPFDYGDGQNGTTFQVRVTQSSGGVLSAYCEVHLYWDV